MCRDKSLIDLESRRWNDIHIHYNKYYDEAGFQEWYEDIEIIYETNDILEDIIPDNILEDDDEEKINPNIKL